MPNHLNNKNPTGDESLNSIYTRLLEPQLNISSISTRTDIDIIKDTYKTTINPSEITEKTSSLLPQLLDKFLTIDHFDEKTSVNFKHFIRLLHIGQAKNEQLRQAALILDKIATSNTSLEVINKIIANFFNLFNYRVKDDNTSAITLKIVDICIRTIQCDLPSHKNIFYILGRLNSFLETKASASDQRNTIQEKIFQLLKQSTFSQEATYTLFEDFLSTGRLRHGKTYVRRIAKQCIAVGVNPTICQSAVQTPINSTLNRRLTTIPWNITSLSIDNSTETNTNDAGFPIGSKLATSFSFGLFAGALDTMSQLLLHIVKRKGCSTSALRQLKLALMMANTLAISSLPLAYVIVENIAEENNPLIASDKIKLFAYTFMTSLFLQGLREGTNYLWKNYLTKKITTPFFSNLSQFLFNLLPFLACFWMIANGEEDFQEGLCLAGSSFSGAMLPPLVTKIGACFFSKSSLTKRSNNITPVSPDLNIAMTSQNPTLFAPSSSRLDQATPFIDGDSMDKKREELILRLMMPFSLCDELQNKLKKGWIKKNTPEKEKVISILMRLKGLLADERLTTSNDNVILELIKKISNYATELKNTVSDITSRKIADKLLEPTQKLSEEMEHIYQAYQTFILHKENGKERDKKFVLYDKLPLPRPLIINDPTKAGSPSLNRQ